MATSDYFFIIKFRTTTFDTTTMLEPFLFANSALSDKNQCRYTLMSPSKSADTIFTVALDLPAHERCLNLNIATRGDASLRQGVERPPALTRPFVFA